MSLEGAKFLKKQYPDLHKSESAKHAVARKRAAGEKITNAPEAAIDAHIERLESVFLNPNAKERERAVEKFLPHLYKKFVIKDEDFPESHFDLQRRIAREQGHGEIYISEETRKQNIRIAQQDQRKSLEVWARYLASDDAAYEPWFKYFAFRHITGLSQYDKDSQSFKKRTKYTTASFPELDPESLANVAAKVKDYVENEAKTTKRTDDVPHTSPESGGAPKETVAGKAFNELYAKEIGRVLKARQEGIEGKSITAGAWVKYDMGDKEGAKRLYDSLQGKFTGWCTAGGDGTADRQIEEGDFEVYYTNDPEGKPTNPRLAIRMQGSGESASIQEVRGILENQNVEPVMADVLKEKLESFGQRANRYNKKTEDMARVTRLDAHLHKNEPLSNEDLTWLYSEDIRGFGYRDDPRVLALRLHYATPEALEFMLDQATITAAGLVLQHLPDDTKVGKRLAKKLIEKGGISYVANGVSRFDLDAEIGLQLIQTGEINALYGVLGHIESFDGLRADDNLASEIITANPRDGYRVIGEYLDTFESGLDPQIAHTIIANYRGYSTDDKVVRNYQKFRGLDANKELALELLRADKALTIVDNISVFGDLRDDAELGMMIINSATPDSGRLVASTIHAFNDLGLDSDFAEKLLEEGNVRAVVTNLGKFKGLRVDRQLALKIASSDSGLSYFREIPPLQKFLDSDMATALVEQGGSYDDIANSIGQFHDLDERVAKGLMDGAHVRRVFNNLASFRDGSVPAELAMTISDTEDTLIVLRNLRKFKDLKPSKEFILKASQSGAGKVFGPNSAEPEIAREYVRKAGGLDNDLAMALLYSHSPHIVAHNLPFFHDLSSDVMDTLIRRGYGHEVRRFPDRFRPA